MAPSHKRKVYTYRRHMWCRPVNAKDDCVKLTCKCGKPLKYFAGGFESVVDCFEEELWKCPNLHVCYKRIEVAKAFWMYCSKNTRDRQNQCCDIRVDFANCNGQLDALSASFARAVPCWAWSSCHEVAEDGYNSVFLPLICLNFKTNASRCVFDNTHFIVNLSQTCHLQQVYWWNYQGVGVARSRTPNNIRNRSRIFYPTPDVRLDYFLHHTPKFGIPVEMVQFLKPFLK